MENSIIPSQEFRISYHCTVFSRGCSVWRSFLDDFFSKVPTENSLVPMAVPFFHCHRNSVITICTTGFRTFKCKWVFRCVLGLPYFLSHFPLVKEETDIFFSYPIAVHPTFKFMVICKVFQLIISSPSSRRCCPKKDSGATTFALPFSFWPIDKTPFFPKSPLLTSFILDLNHFIFCRTNGERLAIDGTFWTVR